MDDYVTKKEFDKFVDNHFNSLVAKVDLFIVATKVNMRWLITIGLAIFSMVAGLVATRIF